MTKKQRRVLANSIGLFTCWLMMLLMAVATHHKLVTGHREYYFIAGISFSMTLILPILLGFVALFTLVDKWIEKGD